MKGTAKALARTRSESSTLISLQARIRASPYCIRFLNHPGSIRIGNVANQFANRLSLIAFSTSALRSAMGGGRFELGIQEALAALIIFYVLGLVLGGLARRLVEENAQIEVESLFAEITEEQSPNPTVSS